MPDISRSDSARSDSSRPRVSFNRDVHVKRIAGPRTASAYSLLPTPDGSTLVPTAVRRERPRTRKEMQREARDVFRQANNVGCRVSKRTGGRLSSSEPDSGSSNENQKLNNNFMSLDRKKLKKGKKNNLDYLSLEKNNERNKLNLSLEAAKKKQLSPIIESPAATDYFQAKKENNIDRMIRRLSAQSPTRNNKPPVGIVGVVKTPEGDICHNQNQPFSYTENSIVAEQGREEMRTTSPTSDVIYAQVVVQPGSGSTEPRRKSTVHTRVSRVLDGSKEPANGTMTRSATRIHVSPAPNLHDLSVRRQILLSRTESQAKERLNTIKKLKEPRRQPNGLNNTIRYLGNDIVVNEKFENHIRKVPKDVELINPSRTKRESNENETLIQKLSRFGKSKSFVETVPPQRRGSSRLELVKQIFRKKSSDSEDDPVGARYREYRGVHSDPDLSEPDIHTRKRMPTPVSSRHSQDSITRIKNNKNKSSSPSNWFKSLDRLTKKGKSRNDENRSETSSKANSLRFFGDTDQESTVEDVGDLKQKYGLHRSSKPYRTDSESERPESRLTDSTIKGSTGSGYKSKSKYDLDRPDYGIKQMNHRLNNISTNNLSDTSTLKNGGSDYEFNGLKYGPNMSRSTTSVSRNQSPPPSSHVTESPLSRRVQSYGNLYKPKDGRRRFYDSSADSATEYDSSVNSAKSTIYLHAATVGDIPGPKNMYKSDGRSLSRDELSSIGRSTSPTTKKTLSRSISVLAPWRPKFRQENTVNYDTGGKPPLGPTKVIRRSPPREHGKISELRFNTIGRENRRQKDLLR